MQSEGALRGLEDLVVSVGGGEPLTAEERSLAARASAQLRFGIESGNREDLALAERLVAALDGVGARLLRAIGPGLSDRAFVADLLSRLQAAFESGRLRVRAKRVPSLTDARVPELPELPPLAPRTRESSTHSFEVRVVDEVGQGIPGVAVDFRADDPQSIPTNAAGVALLDGARASSASVTLADADALSKVLDPRWEKVRSGKPPKESNLQEVVFRRVGLGPFPLKAELPNTIVIKPPVGKLFARLLDKTGRVAHSECDFTIEGPQHIQGTTDAGGVLLVENLLQGDYTLSLTLAAFEGDPDETSDVVETPLVLLAPDEGSPQIRMLGAVPRSVLARTRMFFNTNKAFLLPMALPSMQKLRRLYVENSPCELLVVGHADTAGSSAFNDELSLERARATIAYLEDDVDSWFDFYSHHDPKRAWGKVEDHLMLMALPDFSSKPKGEQEVRWFQRTRGLSVDGKAGSETRHALIEEYMSLDGASLADFVGEINATAHGCGENFPLDEQGDELDEAPEDDKPDAGDRRVELFFFDPEFGISPAPPAENSPAGSTEYPTWRKRVVEEVELEDGDPDAPRVVFVELADAHFRTNSAVVLPEGENPDATGDHEALTSIGLIATALRFAEDHPDRSLLVAGHTDTVGDTDFNQKLSAERAEVALALLKGGDTGRKRFATLCNGRHTAGDVNQILSWAANAFSGFDCDPGEVDEQAHPQAVKKFQAAYNKNKKAFNPDPAVAPLDVDGDVGELTWGAVYDCYEFALRDELGEDTAGVTELRSKLHFASETHEFLGFGENFPIEELGVDKFRSQANRRVEILFFEPGEEPDIDHAVSDPATSELYLPGLYEREPVGLASAKRRVLALTIIDHRGFPLENRAVTLFLSDGRSVEAFTDDQGVLTEKVPLGVVSVQLEDGRFAHFGDEYVTYEHDPVTDLGSFPAESEGALSGTDGLAPTTDDHNAMMDSFATLDISPLP